MAFSFSKYSNTFFKFQSYANPKYGDFSSSTSVPQVENLAAELVNNTAVLTWDAVAGADGYGVERSLTGAGSWTEIDDVATNTSTDTYTVADTGYDYRVRAYIGATYGAYSGTLSGVYSPALWDTGTGAGATIAGRSPTLGSTTWSLFKPTAKDIIADASGYFLGNHSGAGAVPEGYYNTGRTTYTFEAEYYLQNAGGILFRYVDDGNHWWALIGTTSLIIYSKTGGGSYVAVDTVAASFTASQYTTFTVDDIGTGFTVTARNHLGTEYSSTQVSTLHNTATQVGVKSGSNVNSHRWRNMLARRQ